MTPPWGGEHHYFITLVLSYVFRLLELRLADLELKTLHIYVGSEIKNGKFNSLVNGPPFLHSTPHFSSNHFGHSLKSNLIVPATATESVGRQVV